jgi:hypothetical protein
VAELEFAEAVSGICVRSFNLQAQATENEAATRASSDARRKPTALLRATGLEWTRL